MKEHTIVVAADGTIRCLWTDALPLGELGRIEVERASTVEFNGGSQQWEVRLASDPEAVAFSHPSREVCLDWERETIDARL